MSVLSYHDALKARFAHARRELDLVLDRLTDKDMAWSPAPGMRTVAGQIYEILSKEHEVVGWIKTGEYVEPDPPLFGVGSATLAEVRPLLAEKRRETLAYLDSHPEEFWSSCMQCPAGWWESLRLEQCPRGEILRNIAVHEWYHTGQLVIYLWSRGDDPYCWS